MVLLTCYNKGCGQKFDPATNSDEACVHHPGVPVFHDALKGWSCCRKRSTDFTEFLNIPGCSKGPHSNEKPPEPEKNTEEDPAYKEEVIVVQPPKIAAPLERPPADELMVNLPVMVSPSLKQALEKKLQELSLKSEIVENDSAETQGVPVGTCCKNNACKKRYEDESSNSDTCVYHTGVPIFHEGLKYWSCCRRKTTEFDNFLEQEGCARGSHNWFKKEDSAQKVVCRYDWHQTPSAVSVAVYSKVPVPEKSFVQANAVKLNIHIEFEGGEKIYDNDFILHGVIDPQKSNVKMMGTKVEINLKKAEPGSWAKLELPPELVQSNELEVVTDDMKVVQDE
ncbi:cysteine and histidine-rich domain-containing protein 1 isoform X2 [Lingula anatina]|uniref:Cysteine and histidine-rich domain-containing protein 1 isoform X1 n=1 Tax=Lingula anatina TaxID=7574 RepID=A0A1S3KFS4_LINAN|nr:cysteine and histidine-rich domain-containing protein 1 isoform X1 [Lingula anatina]XP_013421491.1 cysteine and histidine-rich domain-containing protein 1 isoform X2 [Lingula anatina]|eukprot:XP_013421490.1 cysteine and histidine-rich domain-containing protein 1 isoform X1 [Lingula anatina]